MTRQIAGFATELILPNETGTLEIAGYHTFDEGIKFYKMLDNLSPIISRCGVAPSRIENLLAVLERNKTTLYVNEAIRTSLQIRAKGDIKANSAVGIEEIAGIERVNLEPGIVPDSAGYLLLLSDGWRRGFCFDFLPVAYPTRYADRSDPEIAGGQLLTHLFYTEYFLLSETEWNTVIKSGWFPFMYLIGELWDGLFVSLSHSKPIADKEQNIYEAFRHEIADRSSAWLRNSLLASEKPYIERAIAAFMCGDWITTVSLLTPRIEGLMRKSLGSYKGHGKLVEDLESFVVANSKHAKSLLFPKQLSRYFKEVFLQYVDFQSQCDTINRHTVAHGMAPASSICRTHALQILLLLDHLYYCFPAEEVELEIEPVDGP